MRPEGGTIILCVHGARVVALHVLYFNEEISSSRRVYVCKLASLKCIWIFIIPL